MKQLEMDLYGLIGNPLAHSFSAKHFNSKFLEEGIDAKYELFPLQSIDDLPELIQRHPNLKGLNVTIPYKQTVKKYISQLDPAARIIGAINTIKIKYNKGEPCLTGYNTDSIGFEKTLNSILAKNATPKALVLGTGGSSNAIRYVLRKRGIVYRAVSRTGLKMDQLTYPMVTHSIIKDYPLIINTTPVGMFPNDEVAPDIPYQYLTKNHILIDLIYNPEETMFLKNGNIHGASIANGAQMFVCQAEAAWKIWSSRK